MAGEFIIDAAKDAALDYVADNAIRYALCTSAPASYAAIAAATVCTYTVTAGDGNGDFTIGDGDTSGRKLTVAQQTGTNASGTGTATHVVLHDNSSLLLAITALSSSQAITSGNPVTINAVDILEIRDAAAA